MTCDFCGADGASPMSIPSFDLPDYPWQDDVDYPVAHNCNVCRKCLPDQLARASHGRLVKGDPLHLFTIAAYMLIGLAIGQHEVEGTVAGLVWQGWSWAARPCC